MEQQFKQKNIVIILGVILLIALGVLAYNYSQKKDKIEFLQEEKELFIAELEIKDQKIDSLIQQGKFNVIELEASKEEIAQLKDSIGRLNVRIKTLRKFKADLDRLKSKYSWLRTRNDSLYSSNNFLKEKVGSSRVKITELESQKQKVTNLKDILERKNKDLEDKIREKTLLHVKGIEATAFKLKSNGSISKTQRSAAIEKLRVCFTLMADPNVGLEQKNIFIQFVDPSENVIPDETGLVVSESSNYSKQTIIAYDGQEKEVCDYITVPKASLGKGRYTANIYDGAKLISSTIFHLK